MKTLIVLSDSHGKRANLERLRPLFAENDYIVHLGDGSADMRDIAREFPQKTIVLKGNCDFSYGMEEYVLACEEVRILCCHGHKYGVKSGLSRLAARAKVLGCAAALYGHTHRAAAEETDGVLCVNPGAAGSYTEPTYGYIVVHGSKLTAVTVPVPAAR